MKLLRLYSLFILGFIHLGGLCQNPITPIKIKIEKEVTFVKAAFDEAEYKVIAFDKYGNPHIESVKEFTIEYSDGKNIFKAKAMGNKFPEKTIKFLTQKRETATNICLRNIKAENKDGHLEEVPDLCGIIIFPDCKKMKSKKN